MLVSADTYALHLVYGQGSAWFVSAMELLSMVGAGTWLVALVAVFLNAVTRRFSLWLGATLLLNGTVVWFLKDLFHRARPFMTLPNVRPFGSPVPTDFSFPSGHSAGSFCFAFFCSTLLIQTRTLPLRSAYVLSGFVIAIACGVALSRVALGVHYPSDVLAGAIVGGALGATSARLFVRRIADRAR